MARRTSARTKGMRRRTSSPVIDFHSHIIVMYVCDFVKRNRPPEATEYQLVDNYLRGAAAQRKRHPRSKSDELAARLLGIPF